MNSIQRAFAYSLVGVSVVVSGCKSSTPPSTNEKSMPVAANPIESLVVKPSEQKPSKPKQLVINTQPVFVKIDNGLIKLGILKEEQIKKALIESGVKDEHVDIFTANIQEKFAYYQDLFTKGEVHIQELEYVEDLDLSNVELEITSGEDFDLGMGFPGEVDSRQASDLHVDPKSLLVTDEGVYFLYKMGNDEEIKEGLVKPKFSRPIIFYYGDKNIIVVDPTKGFIKEEPKQNNPIDDNKVAGVYNPMISRIFS